MANNSKQAAWVALGSLFSFGFSIVSSMILSRYFDKGDYGTYKQVIYVYHTLLTVFTLGLPKAFSYFLPRVEISQAHNLIKKITNIFFILGLIFSLALYVFSPQIAQVMNNPDLEVALKIFSPVPLLMLPTMGLEGILSTYRKNKFMALYTVFTRMIMLICVSIPVVVFSGSYIHAIIGFVVASFIAFLLAIYLKYMPVKGQGREKCEISYKQIFDFSLPLLYASFWGFLITSSDQFFISRYFGNETFAEFSNGALELPFVGMIVAACSTVLSPIFSRLSNGNVNPQKEILPLWTSVFEKSSMLIYPILIYCIVFADIIMIVMYGEQYEVSASYFRIKAIIDFFRVVAYAPLIINIGKVKFYANVHMYSAFILIALEYLSVITIHSPYALITISVFCAIGRISVMFVFVSRYLKVKPYKLFPLHLVYKLIIPSMIILVIEHYVLVNVLNLMPLIALIVSLILYGVLFVFYSRLLHLNYIKIIVPLIKK